MAAGVGFEWSIPIAPYSLSLSSLPPFLSSYFPLVLLFLFPLWYLLFRKAGILRMLLCYGESMILLTEGVLCATKQAPVEHTPSAAS
jgi:hypothetical protein